MPVNPGTFSMGKKTWMQIHFKFQSVLFSTPKFFFFPLYDKNVVTFGANRNVEFVFNLTKNHAWYDV